MKTNKVLKKLIAFVLVMSFAFLGSVQGITSMTASAASNIVIAGIDIGYADGDYFTKNGKVCGTCHQTGVCETATAARCNCMRYWPTGVPSTCQIDLLASQCWGYARYCQWKVYGYHESSNKSKFVDVVANKSANECTASYLKSTFQNTPAATHIRFNGYHSGIIISATDYGVNYTDCNNDGQCGIRYITWSWDQFATYTQKKGGIDYANVCTDSAVNPPPTHPTHSYTTSVTAPTCTAKGYTTHTCSCGDSFVDSYVNALGHDSGTWRTTTASTCTAAGVEKCYCNRCGTQINSRAIAALGHNEKNAVTVEPTCKGEGEMTYTCTRCGNVRKEVIAPKGHDVKNAVWVTTVESGCESKGEQTAYCPDCGELFKTRETAALGHTEGEWTVSTAPSCTQQGEEACHCKRCGEIIATKKLKALGHDEGTWVVTRTATCLDNGEEVCFCTRCGKAIDKRVIAATGHDSGVWKVDFEATADHAGQMSKYCSKCDCVLESKSFEKHTHTEGYREVVKEPTCTTAGEGGIFCKSCSAKFGTYEIPALGHDYSAWYTNKNGTHSRTCSRCHDFETANCDYDITVKEPTCTEGGYTTYVCKDCGYTYKDNFTQALGHSFSEWTDNGDGTHSRKCAGCGETETAEHTWGEWIYDKNAKLCKNGTKTRTCEDCGLKETVEAKHTAILCKIPYTIILWLGNLLKKLGYIISLDWFLPGITIKPIF